MNKLYTLGYQTCSSASEIFEMSQQLGNALVVDIRYNPYSSNPAFTAQNLKQVLGQRYGHVQALGNVNYRVGSIRIAQPIVGLQQLFRLLERSPVILLCCCANYAECHRKTVVELVTSHPDGCAVQVEHLQGKKAKASEIGANQIPAITVRQFWASLIIPTAEPALAHGYTLVQPKNIENRTWSTTYRGPLLIHAGKAWDTDLVLPNGRAGGVHIDRGFGEWLRTMGLGAVVEPLHQAFAEGMKLGGIIGVVDLVDCVRQSDSPWFIPGQYGWVLQKPRVLPFVPCSGRQKLWIPSDEVMAQLGMTSQLGLGSAVATPVR